MTDDEAFIRAIVAAPGDDAPRLVYADWLDERGDPRGAYLRSEVGWARTRRKRVTAPTLRSAVKLDPVWIARVSRPPLGVCLDQSYFAPVQHETDIGLIAHTEAVFDLQLPAEYRALLLNYNGGTFRTQKPRTHQSPPTYRFHRLTASWHLPSYSVRVRAFRAGTGDLRTMIHAHRHDYATMTDWGGETPSWWAHFLPIASPADPDQPHVYLGLIGPYRGRVYEFNYLVGMERRGIVKLALSLGSFFQKWRLRPRSH